MTRTRPCASTRGHAQLGASPAPFSRFFRPNRLDCTPRRPPSGTSPAFNEYSSLQPAPPAFFLTRTRLATLNSAGCAPSQNRRQRQYAGHCSVGGPGREDFFMKPTYTGLDANCSAPRRSDDALFAPIYGHAACRRQLCTFLYSLRTALQTSHRGSRRPYEKSERRICIT